MLSTGHAADGLKNAFSTAWASASKLSIGLGAVGAAVSVVSLLITQHNKKVEEMRRRWQESISEGKKASEDINGIQSALSAYDDIQKRYNAGKATKDELDEATKTLITTLGIEEDQIQRLVSEYGNLDNAIRQVSADKIQEATDKIANGYAAAKNALDDLNKEKFFGGQWSEITWMEETAEAGQKLGKALEEAGLIGSGNYNKGGSKFLGDDTVEAYQTMIEMQEALTKAAKDGTLGMSLDELYQTDIWEQLSGKIAKASDAVENYLYFVDELNARNIADIVSDFGDVSSLEQFNTLYTKLTDGVGESSNVFVGSIDDQTEAIERFLLESPKLADFYKQTPKYIEDATKKYRDSFIKNMSGDSTAMRQQIMHWFDDLAFEDKELVVNLAVNNDSSMMWNLDQWRNSLQKLKEEADVTTGTIQDFYAVMKDDSDTSLNKAIESAQSRVQQLLDLRKSLGGSLDASGKADILAKFPDLYPYIDDIGQLNNAIDAMINSTYIGIDARFAEEIKAVGGASTEAGRALSDYLHILQSIRDLGAPDIENERTIFSNIQSAINNSNSPTGMTTQDIENITKAFGKLKGYNPEVLFERTAGGVQLNETALRALNREYANSVKQKYAATLQGLSTRYQELQAKMQGAHTAQQALDWQKEMAEIQDAAEAVKNEAAQYDGLTSAYNRYVQATSQTDARASWEGMGSGLEKVEEILSGGWVNDSEVLSFINVFLEEGAQIDEWGADTGETFARVQETISRYFDGTTGSLETFLQEAMVAQGELDYIKQTADGEYIIDFDIGGEEKLADLMSDMYGVQLSAESIHLIMDALHDAGFYIEERDNLDEPIEKFATLQDQQDYFKDQSAAATNFNVQTGEAITSLNDLNKTIDDTQNNGEEEISISADTQAVVDSIDGLSSMFSELKSLMETYLKINVDDTEATTKLSGFQSMWDNLHDKFVTLHVQNQYQGSVSGPGEVNGTAFAKGNWGTRDSGVALGGELGRELVVRDGKYFTIGDNGAEFFHYKHNDIIFNAKQTAELFKYGGTRGRGLALVSGTAFGDGTSGHGRFYDIPNVPSSPSSPGTDPQQYADDVQDAAEDVEKTVEEIKEVFDWIQVKIARIERDIANLGRTAESVYKTWSERNSALDDELAKVAEEMEIQQQGYDRYMQEAESVGLDEEWAEKVREGLIDIERLQSEATEESKEETEALIDKIKEYQQWYLNMPTHIAIYACILFNCWKPLRAI